ncbi:hypothetical protein B0H16DRAFT_1736107 [Mycena metata]|uniref:Uncharacterized protein n=1 Tax=Mycena metata TaxID=1033252 RepID=A0AAD7HQL4_9AGAR|nr:hypothetical protein B0H16DRAFT_1480282 [Mycena metata]KAJ7725579.1 hypothetical protein B0H16DRAFT_1736107 [Mycena metata]
MTQHKPSSQLAQPTSQTSWTPPLPHGSYTLPHKKTLNAEKLSSILDYAPTPTSTPTATPLHAPTPTVAPPVRQCCPMPYFPDAGVDARVHSEDAGKFFYVVKAGRKKGTYTNDTIATAQVKKFSGFSMRAVGTYDAAVAEWEQNCLDNHGPVCADAPTAARERESRSVSPTLSIGSVGSITSSQLSDIYDEGSGFSQATFQSPAKARYGGTPSQPPPSTSSRPPITMDTRLFLPADEQYALDEGKFWGVPGVLSTFGSRTEAVQAARQQGIPRPNVWGHADKRVIDDFIRSTVVSSE